LYSISLTIHGINHSKQSKEVENVHFIGNINIKKLGNYKNIVTTDKVIITSERIEHIKKRHPGDFEKYISYVPIILENPDYILEDTNNKNTILLLKTLQENGKNIQVVIKLHTDIKDKNKYNSILTFWHIRDRNYKSTIRNNKILYNYLDKRA